MSYEEKKMRAKMFSIHLAMYIPLFILYNIIGRVFVRETEGMNFMMNVVAIPCCIIYYKITKKNNYYLYLLFFLSLSFDNFFTHIVSFLGAADRIGPMLLIFRNIFTLLIIFEADSIINWIAENKIIVTITCICINIILLVNNNYLSSIFYKSWLCNFLFKWGIVFITFSIIICVIKALRDKEFIEIIFMSCLMLIIIRKSSILLKMYINYDGSLFFNEKWIFYFALYILPIGLFVEYTYLLKDNKHLEKEVEIISQDIKEFQEIDKLRMQFFANMSHEMRTPINVIFSGLQLIESKRELGEDAVIECYNRYEPIIRQNCFRILRLTNNIVDMTKLDAGFMKMNFQNVDIVNLVEDTTMAVVHYVENKNMNKNIIFDTLVEEKILMCDKDGIERMILNLISNAIKFTNENGNIFITVEEEEGYVVIKIKDDGIGISEEDRKIMFNTFVQGDKSLNRTREGSGIGLSLVKAIIEKHSGSVKCENVDCGTEIVVRLPDKILQNDNEVIYSDNSDLMLKIDTEFSDIY